jgi:hypothetical protein
VVLNWSLQNIQTLDNDIIPVRKNGRSVGYCKIIIEQSNVVGLVTLNEDLDNSQFVLYSISTPNLAGQIFLEGILLVDYYDGLEKRAKKAEDMKGV